ncbi:P-loop containing nucleoside triphosphate hydrolase protein [Coemansia reversa NRRL 1564]|uniref:P-loop containing nucleoside triphosphate hydrolase protein n=1 Tax=Coemansia reversa (strain ATCC 12441 / NRRL 1564) TaxID=763665 RepID=A0A2G5B4E3_COERN|nr:P-loop containing nucleoside triphosphate hydrolase protein [Coemansia reversa NRRL 1564]|eukprot:PIA13870.1 P-loop containing nucleoside triphosphate hydrolase protein [Coemansia reversa NRRL 1564]
MQRVLALLAANGVLTYAQAAVAAALGERVGERLQKRALGALVRHELGLLDAAQPGALVTRTRADIAEVQAAARALAQGLRATATVVGVAWRLVRLSPALALTLGAAAAAAYAGLAAYGRELRVQQRGVREWEAVSAAVAAEAAALGRVAAVAALAPADGVGGRRLKHVDGHLRFMDVDFRYPTRPGAVLRGFSLDVPAGQVVALCGPSGVGKSTVALLLQRLYEPTRGEIWLDACPLALLDAAWLRRQIAAVPQDPALFSTTILENLRMANPAADDAAVVQACRDANAHEFIERLPAGYHTVVGPRGALLSGGQRQRLGIARALLRDPRILVLDEATSALDPDCERDVVAALERLMRGRTVLVIAHRLATIRRADHIVVMGRVPGHIVEQGTHDSLIARRGAYARLHREMEQDVGGSVE